MSVLMVALSSGRMLNKHQVEVDRQSPYGTNFWPCQSLVTCICSAVHAHACMPSESLSWCITLSICYKTYFWVCYLL